MGGGVGGTASLKVGTLKVAQNTCKIYENWSKIQVGIPFDFPGTSHFYLELIRICMADWLRMRGPGVDFVFSFFFFGGGGGCLCFWSNFNYSL